MGSGSSRLGSRRARPRRLGRPQRRFSSLLICGASTSDTPDEMEDDPSELPVHPTKSGDPVVDELRRRSLKGSSVSARAKSGLTTMRTEPETENGRSSESCLLATQESLAKDDLTNNEKNNKGKCLHECKELIHPHQFSGDGIYHDTASSSYENNYFPGAVSTNMRSSTDLNNMGAIINKHEGCESHVSAEVKHPNGSSSPELVDYHLDELSAGEDRSEVVETPDSESDTASAFVVSESRVTSQPQRGGTPQLTTSLSHGIRASDGEQGQGAGSSLNVDAVSISSSTLSTNSDEISNRDSRRNSRRLFWDAFSRRSSRRHSASRRFLFSPDETDGIGSHGRWLLDYTGDNSDDGFGSDSAYTGNSTHNINERRWHLRTESRERHGGRRRRNTRTNICPAGLHPEGTCSCESILMAEEPGTRASISRIVMLAEALFEVLDEIHQQPMSIALSVLSLPASETIVDSFPVKCHSKPETTDNGDEAAQCYICLSEYDDGDRIRVLPCHHEFHLSCVDKWLKEIHGVCPLCRGDVREGFTEGALSNLETAPP